MLIARRKIWIKDYQKPVSNACSIIWIPQVMGQFLSMSFAS